ncbi:PIN domain-like protein [Abortiporus biennis]
MRQKRAKAYRKLMSLYCMSFGFRQPYQVLMDSEMCKEAISHKIELVKQLGVVLQGEVKPMITQCCIHELYLQGKSQQPAVDLAKTFERRKCNHREPIPGDDCLSDVVGETNKHRYVIATQSTSLRQKLRATPAVPIVHINRSVMILEPPSDITLQAKEREEQKLLLPSASETSRLQTTPVQTEPPKKKKKGPKGPNPLSVKKKKPATAQNNEVSSGAKRKRDNDEGGEDHAEKVSEAAHSGHKRKRRRKGAVSAVVDPA